MSTCVKRSTGCYTCRRRKVKCDEAKPECMKCQRGGRICSGYRSEQQLVFRSMNTSVAAKAYVPATTTALTLNTGPDGASALSESYSSTLYIRPSTEWEQSAIARFMAHFVEATSNSTPGYMEFLPQMLRWTFASTRDAFLAVSLANLGNVLGMQELQVKAKVHYGRALQVLQAALNDTATAATDSTLLTVVILQMYEIISGTIAPPGAADPHETATTALLRLRESTPNISQASKKLSEMVQTRKEIQGVFLCLDDKEASTDSSSSPGASFRLPLRKVAISCASLQSAILQARRQESLGNRAFVDALKHTIETYGEVARWPNSTPVGWRYKPHIAPKDIRACGVSQVFLFKGIQHGAIWQIYFCSRIHLCQSLLQAYGFFSQQRYVWLDHIRHALTEKDIRTTLFAAVDDICSCAPYLLGDVDREGHMNRSNMESKALGAFFLLRGLMVANTVEGLPLRQRRLVLDLLYRVGAQFGIRAAWGLREGWIAGHRAEAEQL